LSCCEAERRPGRLYLLAFRLARAQPGVRIRASTSSHSPSTSDATAPRPTEVTAGYAATRIQCRLEDETLWLTQAQIAELFQTTPQNVTLHLKSIFAEGELAEEATCKDCLQVRDEGKRAVSRRLRHYRLEAILAVGYRVRSHRNTQFRQWATARLGEYPVKGFTMDGDDLSIARRLDRGLRDRARGWIDDGPARASTPGLV